MADLKGSNEGNYPSPKSLNELMKLLVKLNNKLREKLSPRPQKTIPEKLDVVIIIMTNQEEKAKANKSAKSGKKQLPNDDWIKNLIDDIEKHSSEN